jgi:hypothetical protein
MYDQVAEAYQQLDDARPLVRPTHSQFEVDFLPPLGDPEVHIPTEIGTYVATGILVDRLVEHLHDD